ncbi:unnamed protein product [Anisakis simplex]|uniref:CLASP_N domain-containing protein n=1 Tax=Anisakis simplex TaxID=6269 RepID=A0A0M3JWH4_ANISI|nr:unnamed protein product [Anisakis simplex]
MFRQHEDRLVEDNGDVKATTITRTTFQERTLHADDRVSDNNSFSQPSKFVHATHSLDPYVPHRSRGRITSDKSYAPENECFRCESCQYYDLRKACIADGSDTVSENVRIVPIRRIGRSLGRSSLEHIYESRSCSTGPDSRQCSQSANWMQHANENEYCRQTDNACRSYRRTMSMPNEQRFLPGHSMAQESGDIETTEAMDRKVLLRNYRFKHVTHHIDNRADFEYASNQQPLHTGDTQFLHNGKKQLSNDIANISNSKKYQCDQPGLEFAEQVLASRGAKEFVDSPQKYWRINNIKRTGCDQMEFDNQNPIQTRGDSNEAPGKQFKENFSKNGKQDSGEEENKNGKNTVYISRYDLPITSPQQSPELEQVSLSKEPCKEKSFVSRQIEKFESLNCNTYDEHSYGTLNLDKKSDELSVVPVSGVHVPEHTQTYGEFTGSTGKSHAAFERNYLNKEYDHEHKTISDNAIAEFERAMVDKNTNSRRFDDDGQADTSKPPLYSRCESEEHNTDAHSCVDKHRKVTFQTEIGDLKSDDLKASQDERIAEKELIDVYSGNKNEQSISHQDLVKAQERVRRSAIQTDSTAVDNVGEHHTLLNAENFSSAREMGELRALESVSPDYSNSTN